MVMPPELDEDSEDDLAEVEGEHGPDADGRSGEAVLTGSRAPNYVTMVVVFI